MDKKGQGLSLNVIIVAALALIVLVVLVTVFIGEIGDKTSGISKAGRAEIALLKIQYGDCHPSASAELSFDQTWSQATDPQEKELIKADFIDNEISRCKNNPDKASCEAAGCRW